MSRHRPNSQVSRLRKLLEDGLPHSTPEICEKVYGASHLGLARVPSRIHEIRVELEDEGKGMFIDGWDDPNTPTIHWYQMRNIPKRYRTVVEHVMRDGVRVAVLRKVAVEREM